MRSLAFVVVAVTCTAGARAQGRSNPPPLPPVQAIGAWTPVPELPGMGRPVDTAAVALRRRALAARIGRGVALIPAAHERDVERDYVQDNDFRQTNTFFYLTELETQDAWLLIVAGGEAATTVLFLPPRTPSQERWTGLRLGPDSTAARLSGIGRVLPTDSLDRMLAALFRASGPIYAPLDVTTRDEPRLKEMVFSGRDVRNLRPLVDSMRLVKDGDEIARMRKAIDISAAGHVAAMQAARPGVWEYELEAALEAAFRRNGADRLGYPSIVGSGPNSTTLHYDVNRRQTRDGDLVVVDAGAEWGQYTADVTRTFPVNGKRAGHVGRVLSPLGPRIHDDQVAVSCLAPVHVVVQRGAVRAAPHDRRIAEAVRAVAAEGGLQGGLELVLPHAGARRLHRGDMSRRPDVDRLAHPRNLIGILEEPHRVDQRAEVADVAPGEHQLLEARFVPRGDVERHVDGPGRAEQRRRKHPVERVGGEHAADAGEPRRRAVGPEPETGPALLRGGTRRQEEHRRRRLAARHDPQPRSLGLELRQVEEGIGLTEIVVLDVVTLEVPLVRRGNES